MTADPSRLHVLRCYERLPPLQGGMERHIAELTAAQRKQGVRVTEIYNRGEPQGESIQLWPGRNLDRLRPCALREALFYAAAARQRFDFSDRRMRVVHIHGDWPSFLFGSMFGWAIGADAVAASLHATFHSAARRYARSVRRCNLVFTTGLRQAKTLESLLGRTVVHLPSAPADLFFEPPERLEQCFDVVAVGSLVPVKNHDLLIRCAALRPGYRFLLLGDGPDRDRLRELARKHGAVNVTIRGPVSAGEVRTALQSSRIFVNTSWTEGSPTAALEAMACGLPVVLTPSNDYSDLVEQGGSGLVTSTWDLEEVLQAIDSFLTNPQHLAARSQAARRLAQVHRWSDKAALVTDAMLAAAARGDSIG